MKAVAGVVQQLRVQLQGSSEDSISPTNFNCYINQVQTTGKRSTNLRISDLISSLSSSSLTTFGAGDFVPNPGFARGLGIQPHCKTPSRVLCHSQSSRGLGIGHKQAGQYHHRRFCVRHIHPLQALKEEMMVKTNSGARVSLSRPPSSGVHLRRTRGQGRCSVRGHIRNAPCQAW